VQGYRGTGVLQVYCSSTEVQGYRLSAVVHEKYRTTWFQD